MNSGPTGPTFGQLAPVKPLNEEIIGWTMITTCGLYVATTPSGNTCYLYAPWPQVNSPVVLSSPSDIRKKIITRIQSLMFSRRRYCAKKIFAILLTPLNEHGRVPP